VVAAGSGERLGAPVPKAFVPLRGRPLLAWCLDALAGARVVEHLVLVAPAGWEDAARDAVPAGLPAPAVVAGGATRARSVARGLLAVPARCATVLVHDAARPLVTPGDVRAVLGAVGAADGALAAAPLADTLKRVGADGAVTDTPDRSGLWRAQTPQAFRAAALRGAVARAEADGTLDAATDCSALVTRAAGRVVVVPADAANLKVTTPDDLALAELVLASRARGTAPSVPDAVG
jgi:2-C-methyl-D-erythritol 4-phosphate cytidylyltransferase